MLVFLHVNTSHICYGFSHLLPFCHKYCRALVYISYNCWNLRFFKFCFRVLILFSRFMCITRLYLYLYSYNPGELTYLVFQKFPFWVIWIGRVFWKVWFYNFNLNFNFLAISVFSSKELLNFQTPGPRTKVSLLTKNQQTGEWSNDRAFRISVF